MNSQKKLKTKGKALLLLLLSFGLNSCKKTIEPNTAIKEGVAQVIVNMLGIDENNEPLATTNGAASGKLASEKKMTTNQISNSEGVQETIVPFYKDISIVATLVPQGVSAVSETAAPQSRIAAVKPVTKAAANVISQTPLVVGKTYRIIVYNDAGVRVATKDYVHGNEANTVDFLLDGGKTYTFVAYSMNSTATVAPSVTNSDNLSTAVINTISGDLMYFKKTMVVTGGNNYLNIILKHKFSQITTNIVLDGGLGNITAISGVTITPARNSASIKLANDSITYNVSGSANVVFPAIATGGVRTISSGPKLILTPLVTNGTLAIGSLTAFGITKTNLSIPSLTITPGVKYNLNLKFTTPCTENVGVPVLFTTRLNLPPAGTVAPSKTFSAPGADFGFVFDVTELDNSFNMAINDVPLISKGSSSDHELQFETYGGGPEGAPYTQNIQFADGGKWGVTTGGVAIPQIYSLRGTPAAPMIRIMISSSGTVSMYGSKVNGGPLFPLMLNNGFTFNAITWNGGSTPNKVVISQKVNNGTVMFGSGSGKRIIACTN